MRNRSVYPLRKEELLLSENTATPPPVQEASRKGTMLFTHLPFSKALLRHLLPS